MSNQLKTLREAAGHTQATLAHAVGTTEQTVRKWEKATSVPQMRWRRPLAAALGIPLAEVADLVAAIERDMAGAAEDAFSGIEAATDQQPAGEREP